MKSISINQNLDYQVSVTNFTGGLRLSPDLDFPPAVEESYVRDHVYGLHSSIIILYGFKKKKENGNTCESRGFVSSLIFIVYCIFYDTMSSMVYSVVLFLFYHTQILFIYISRECMQD